MGGNPSANGWLGREGEEEIWQEEGQKEEKNRHTSYMQITYTEDVEV